MVTRVPNVVAYILEDLALRFALLQVVSLLL